MNSQLDTLLEKIGRSGSSKEDNMTKRSEKQKFIRFQNEHRPKKCELKKECTSLMINQATNAFTCCGLLKNPVNLDCVSLCLTVHERNRHGKRMGRRQLIPQFFLTITEVLNLSSLITDAVSNYYAYFDNKEYTELIEQQIKNAKK